MKPATVAVPKPVADMVPLSELLDGLITQPDEVLYDSVRFKVQLS